MQWWNDFVAWFYSEEGWRVVSTAVIPFLAILTAGIVAAVIAKGAVKRMLAEQQREAKASAIAALVRAGRKAVAWDSLPAEEKRRLDELVTEAEIRVRLLPLPGVSSAADWAAHQLASMKNNSASFSFQAEQTFVDYRDRLLEWQDKPKRARKLFAFDLEQWRYEGVDNALAEKQRQWSAGQPESQTAQSELNEDDFEDGVTAFQMPPVDNLATPPMAPAPQTQQTVVIPEPVQATVHPEPIDPYAPPITAGTVRQRLAPEARDTL